jgi:hypothetical protein
MKTALTLTLTASLIATSLPAAAQFPFPPAPRYAPPPRQTPQYPSPPPRVSSDWSHVRAIEPGSRIRVSAVGLRDRDNQYFVSASDRTLTLLVLGVLPRSAKPLVLRLAGSHPELFIAPQKWMEFTDGKVHVNPDGVFIGSRKAADLSDIAKTVEAKDVAEVSAWVRDFRPRPTPVDPALVGAAALPLSALLLGCGDGGHCNAGVAWGTLIGVPVALGVVHAVRANHRETLEVVYRS